MYGLQRVVTMLWDYLALTEEPANSDVLFTFGGPTLCIPQRALELYLGGLGALIVVTGNAGGTYNDSGWAQPTATVFAQFLRQHGVPDEAVVEVPTSSNTLEDCLFGIKKLEAKGFSPKRVIVISRPIHQRRAFATMRLAYANRICLNCPCAEIHPREVQDADVLLSIGKRAVEEIARLRLYGSRNELEQQVIPDDIEQGCQIMAELVSRREEALGRNIRSLGRAP